MGFRVGSLVAWMPLFQMDLPGDIGIILELIPYESRDNDPFPHWRVLFSERGVLHCRECDLRVVED
jgi:hypothetical protein